MGEQGQLVRMRLRRCILTVLPPSGLGEPTRRPLDGVQYAKIAARGHSTDPPPVECACAIEPERPTQLVPPHGALVEPRLGQSVRTPVRR